MARSVDVNRSVSGGRELQRLLQKLPDEITAQVKEALLEAAEIAQAEVVGRVPVLKHPDKRRTMGELRNVLSDRQAIGVRAKGLRVTFGLRTRRLQKRGWYAAFVEYGTKGHSGGYGRARTEKPNPHRKNQRKMRSVPPHPAQPFMRPGFAAAQPHMRRAIDDAVAKALVRATEKYGYKPRPL